MPNTFRITEFMNEFVCTFCYNTMDKFYKHCWNMFGLVLSNIYFIRYHIWVHLPFYISGHKTVIKQILDNHFVFCNASDIACAWEYSIYCNTEVHLYIVTASMSLNKAFWFWFLFYVGSLTLLATISFLILSMIL